MCLSAVHSTCVWITQSQKIVQVSKEGGLITLAGFLLVGVTSYCQALGAVKDMREVSGVSTERVMGRVEGHAGELLDICDSVTSWDS